MTVIIQTEPFEPGALLTRFSAGRSDTGAVVSFTGLARDDSGPQTRLTLEAYPGFSERRIEDVGEQARTRFALTDLLVIHRVGEIAPGEAIVFVAAAARHRREAFEAADFMMDYLKSRAPFWKKEAGPEGERWIEPTARDHSDVERWDPVLRPATPADHAAMEALQVRASLATGEHVDALQANPHVITTDAANIEAGRAVLAMRGDALIGFIALDEIRDLEMEIEGLFIEPDHWRQGVGARLMAAAEDVARREGAQALGAIAGHFAEAFYASQGFIPTGSASTLFGPAAVLRKLL